MKRLSLAIMGLAIASLMTMVSCRKPNVNNVVSGAPRTVTFTATTESGNGSKTTLDGVYNVNWSANDQIKVNNQTLTLATGAGTKNGTFTGEVSGTEFYAGYPVNAVKYTAPSTLIANIPEEMEYNVENQTEGLVRMVAHATSSGDNVMLNFKNAHNLLKLSLKGKYDSYTAPYNLSSRLTSITLVSSTSAINGDIAVTFSGDEPAFGFANGNNATTITFGSTGLVLTSDATKDVYIPIPRINGGELTIKFTCQGGSYMKKKINIADLNSYFNAVNYVLNLGELTVDATTSPSMGILNVLTNNVCGDCQYKGASGTVYSTQLQECEYGFVYAKTSVNSNPEIGGTGCTKFRYAIGNVTNTGLTFNADLDLETGVQYSYRAYAISERDVKSYGDVKTITGGDGPQALPQEWINGENTYPFTVASGKTVHFSQGNLQYIGSSTTWKFAEHQFDFLGNNGQGSTSETVDRDLFGWGTSGVTGYSPIATCVEPWSTSEENTSYYAYGDYQKNLYDGGDNAGKADWGYNRISNGGNTVNSGWRTLTYGEWQYLFESRDNASNLYGKGMVGCTYGVIILPDGWTSCPEGLNFIKGGSGWPNTYNYLDWSKMEAAGAVFLPGAGERKGTTVTVNENNNSFGGYYSSNWAFDGEHFSDQNGAFLIFFNGGSIVVKCDHARSEGFSVRLVKDVSK